MASESERPGVEPDAPGVERAAEPAEAAAASIDEAAAASAAEAGIAGSTAAAVGPASPGNTPRAPRLVLSCALAIVALLCADLASKRWAEGRLSTARLGEAPAVCGPDGRLQRIRRPPLVIVEDVFDLEYAENCGAAFGLLRDAPAVLRGAVFDTAAIAASLVLLFLFVRGRGGPFFAWSVPFVVAGAVGNLVDRLTNGYVVDFIHVHYGDSFDYPTFNVADIAITIGVVLLVIDGFREPADAALPAAGPVAGTAPDAGANRT